LIVISAFTLYFLFTNQDLLILQSIEIPLRTILSSYTNIPSNSIKKEKHTRHHTNFLPFNIIPKHTERTIRDAINGNDEGFIQDMVSFAMVTKKNQLSNDSNF